MAQMRGALAGSCQNAARQAARIWRHRSLAGSVTGASARTTSSRSFKAVTPACAASACASMTARVRSSAASRCARVSGAALA